MERDRSIDIARGIGILAVILGHMDLKLIDPTDTVYCLLYAFHVPMFFVISGYLYSRKSSFKEYFVHKTKAYLIPYTVFAAIMLMFSAITERDPSKLFNMCVNFAFQRRFRTLWFLSALYVSMLMFGILERLLKKCSVFVVWGVSTAIGLLGILYCRTVKFNLWWCADIAAVALIYISYGYVLRKHGIIGKLVNSKYGFLYAAGSILACAVLALVNFKTSGKVLDMIYNSYGYVPLSVPAALLGSTGIMVLSGLIKSKFLAHIGKNSLPYFALHQSVAMVLGIKLAYCLKISNNILFFVFVFLMTLIFSEIIMRIYNFSSGLVKRPKKKNQ